MFHKHNFQKDGLILWCSCGKVKHLECDHSIDGKTAWKVHSEQNIEYHGHPQVEQILICQKCGEFKAVNTITGDIR